VCARDAMLQMRMSRCRTRRRHVDMDLENMRNSDFISKETDSDETRNSKHHRPTARTHDQHDQPNTRPNTLFCFGPTLYCISGPAGAKNPCFSASLYSPNMANLHRAGLARCASFSVCLEPGPGRPALGKLTFLTPVDGSIREVFWEFTLQGCG